MIKKNIILASAALVFCLTTITSYSTILKVTNLNDSGAGSLRDNIAAASSGDTVMMDVSGQISLSSPITIGVPVFIMGAYPIHNTISGPTSGAGEAFIINGINADTVVINGFTISDFAGANAAVLITNSVVRIGDCVFESNIGSANGQSINASGAGCNVKIFNCSFFNNDAGGAEGGAAFVGTGANVTFFNCTFYQNSSNIGGAISTYGDLTLINNTFLNNSAGTGNNIARAIGSSVTLANNIFSNISGTNSFSNAGPNWNNLGGNVHTFNPPAFIPTGGDMTSISQGSLALQATETIDGYGLKYFRVTQQTSPAVDNGVTPAALPQYDCRRAPRIIYGDNALLPDAGASEYTPYRVTSVISPNDFESVWGQMNLLGGFGGPEYMEFELGGPTNFLLSSTMSYTANPQPRIVDGYTQTGSAIAGPRDPFAAGSYVTPAVLPVALLQPTGGVLDIDIWPAGSWIAGLRIDNGPGNGILMTDCQMQFYGNQVVSSAGNGLNGVVVNGFSSDVTVGGLRYHEMNVIGNQQNSVASSGINIGGVNTKVFGNFIGTSSDGLSSQPNAIGISVQPNPGTNYIGGIFDSPSHNLIAGNSSAHIKLAGASATVIRGNIIGTDISTTAPLGLMVAGIDVLNTASAEIGGLSPGKGNIIGFTSTGMILSNGTAPVTVFGNFVGISPYASNGFALIPNNLGIAAIGGNGSISIGNGLYNGRNYISGNAGEGIYFDGADQHLISGNFIGVKPNHTPGPNTANGILIVNTSAQNQITSNVICTNGSSGIFLNGSGSFNNIQNNKIGVDSSGNNALPNANGVSFDGGSGNNYIKANTISGNTNYGIDIVSAMGNDIRNNIIGLNSTQVAAMPNGSHGININGGSNSYIDTNIIAANNGGGIFAIGLYDFSMAGNFIGLNASGTFFGNNGDGIYAENSVIGSIGYPGVVNTIANNAGAGIKLKASDSIAIRSNSIYNNSQLGISINNNTSPLANDINDADVGSASISNMGQNYPVLTNAQVCNSTSTSIGGSVNVDDPAANYYLEFFALGSPDPSGAGEGDSLIHSVTINAGGLYIFNFMESIANAFPVGTVISATCSKEIAAGYYRTSEFSDTISVRGGFTADATVINNIPCNGGGNGSAYVTNNSGIFPITFQWYDAGAGSPLAGQTNDTATFVAPGNYYCVVTDGTSCSVLSDTISITQPAALNTTLSVYNETCAGLNNGGADLVINSGGTPNFIFNWFDSGATLLNSTSNINTGSTIGISSIPPGSYFVVISDANGCQDTLTFTIAAGVSVSAAFTASSTLVCTGSTVSFTDISTGTGGITAWSYDFGDTNTSSVQNPSNTYTNTGNNIVTFIAYIGSCSDTATTTISVSAATTANAGTDLATCDGTPVTLSGTVNAAVSSTWSTNGGGSFSDPALLNAVYTNAAADAGATIEIYLTATSSGTCPNATDTLLLTVDALPVSTAGPDFSVCSGNSAPLSGSVTNAATSLWTTSGTGSFISATSPATSYNPSASDISAGVVTLTLTTSTNGACTAASDALILTIISGPTAVAGPDASVCNGSSYSLDGTGSTGSITAYQWSQVGGGVIGSTSIVSVNPAATTSYALMVDNGTCQSYDTVTITVNLIPDPTFSYSQSAFCMNAGTQTSSPVTSGGTYSSLQAGLTINTSTGDIDPGTSTTGTYDVVYTITSPCFADDTIQIIINGLPDANFSSTSPYCASDANDTLTAVTPGGTFSGTGITDGSVGIFSPSSAGAGTHVITYTVTDANSCTSLIDNNIVVNANPVAVLNTIASSFCTSDAPITLTGSPAGGVFTLNTTILTGGIFDPSTATPGVDTVSYIIIDGNGCVGIDYQLISITNGPPPPATGNTSINYCQGDVINPLTVTSTNTVIWYNDAALTNQIGTGTTLTLPQNLSGINVFYVTQTAGSCTSQPTVITVTVIDGSVINMGGPYLICPDQPVQLNATGATGTVSWSPGTTLSDSTIVNPIATPSITTTYYFVTTISGCTVIDSVTVNVDHACLENIFNAFSPNGDNINDTWIIEGAFTNTNNKVMIFNRWGDKLIELNNYDNVNVVWDGTYKNNPLPAGTYFYIIEYRELQQQFNGWVQITK